MKKLNLVLLMSVVLSAPGFATIYYVTGGYFGSKTISGDDELIMTGGGGDSLIGKDYSILKIQNTSPLVVLSGGLWSLATWNHSQLYLSGGYVNWLDVDDYSKVVLSGGLINKLRNESEGGYSHVEIICKEYSYNTQTKKLTGIWGNDSAFNIQLADLTGYVPTYNILEFTIIPEPMTLLLLSLGGLLIRRK
jgi:hypothetical protein